MRTEEPGRPRLACRSVTKADDLTDTKNDQNYVMFGRSLSQNDVENVDIENNLSQDVSIENDLPADTSDVGSTQQAETLNSESEEKFHDLFDIEQANYAIIDLKEV